MSDFFIHNGDSFLPDYLPGIIGYGQNGAPGNKGENTPSIYYASYDLENKEDLRLAKKRILNKQQLSNNKTLDNDNDYKINDIIVDKTGTFYKISKINKIDVSIDKCANNSSSKYSEITTTFSGFNVRCSTSFLKSSERKWIRENPYYDTSLIRLNYSPKLYHHNRLEKYIYGNSITFNLIPRQGENIDKFTYKFVLVLPNGQTFDYYSEQNVCTIFLENKLLFGCFSTNEWQNLMNFNTTDLKETALSKLIATEEELDIGSVTGVLGDYTKIDPITYVNDELSERGKGVNGIENKNPLYISHYYYNACDVLSELNAYKNSDIFKKISNTSDTNTSDSEENTEENSNSVQIKSAPEQGKDKYTFIANYDHLEKFLQSKEITILLSYYIKYECTAYCEITNTETGVIYRVDINDIFITESLNKNDNRNNFIKEVVNNIVWNHELLKYKNDLSDSNEFNNFLTYKDGDETKLFNPMNAYVMFSQKEDITKPNTITEDGIIENLYFIDASGFTNYVQYNNLELLQDGGYPTEIQNYGFVKERIGSNVNRENLNKDAIDTIRKMWGVTTGPEYRDANRTIKLSFSNLSSIKVNIQYLKTPEASTEYAQTLIYIGYIDHPLLVLPKENPKPGDEEPGIYYLTKVVPPGYYIKENEADYTTTSLAGMTESTINLEDFGISDTKSHYIEIGVTLLDTEGKTRGEINSTHRKSYNEEEKRLYTFSSEEDSGTPDIRIYVSGVNEYTDEEMTKSEDEEFDFNNFNSIHCDKPKDINTTE